MMVRAHRVLVITFNYRQGLLGEYFSRRYFGVGLRGRGPVSCDTQRSVRLQRARVVCSADCVCVCAQSLATATATARTTNDCGASIDRSHADRNRNENKVALHRTGSQTTLARALSSY